MFATRNPGLLLATFTFLLGGCDGLPGGRSDADFVGVWTYDSSSNWTLVGSGYADSGSLQGNLEFQEGSNSDLVLVSDDGCNLRFDLTSDTRADVVAGQTCEYDYYDADGYRVHETDAPSQWSFTQTDDATLSESATVSVTLDYGEYGIYELTFTRAGTLNRL